MQLRDLRPVGGTAALDAEVLALTAGSTSSGEEGVTPCEEAGVHLPHTGHSQSDCPTLDDDYSDEFGSASNPYPYWDHR